MSDEHTIHDGYVRNLRYRLHVAGPAHSPDIPDGSIVIELHTHDLEADVRSDFIEALSIQEARELRDALVSVVNEAEGRAAG
jgi:hypothetical protein